jgi:GGDEF domain-containing protein
MARLGHFVRLCAREVDFPAVLGDDTIAIIFVEADFVRAFNTTQRIIASARDAEIHYGENFAGIKFSAGLAGFPEHGIDPDVLLSSCQSFLAEAKLAAGDVVLPAPSRLLKTSKAMLDGNLTKPQDLANSFAFWGDVVSRNQEPVPLPPARRSSG